MKARWILLVSLLLTLAACSGSEVSDPPGPADRPIRDGAGNLLAGSGWELLEFTRSGLTYGVAVAETPEDVERMWQSLEFDVPAPDVDFASDVLIVLGHAVSGSCPEIQFQGLTIEPDRVFGNFTFIHERDACTSDANAAAYLLAVERSALPDRFVLSLERDDVCGGCDEDTIDVDLTSDVPDESQWWARGRFGIVLGGAPPADSHVFTMHFGGDVRPLAILARDWQVAPQWYTGGDVFPDRVEAFTANCVGGEQCIESLEMLEPTGPKCGANITAEPRQDVAIVITFEADGSCGIELMPGTDGRDFEGNQPHGDDVGAAPDRGCGQWESSVADHLSDDFGFEDAQDAVDDFLEREGRLNPHWADLDQSLLRENEADGFARFVDEAGMTRLTVRLDRTESGWLVGGHEACVPDQA